MVINTESKYRIAEFAGVRLEYKVIGDGEPVLFIHGAIVGESFAPLLKQHALARHRLISYHRRGYLGSTHPDSPVSIQRQAADAAAILDAAGVDRAHVVGHSLGGVIGLQLALDAPERVHSLSLLEPGMPTHEAAVQFIEQIQPLVELFRTGEKAAALDAFCQGLAGPAYRAQIDPVMGPEWFDEGVADLDALFLVEVPSMLDWELTAGDAERIKCPVLSVVGAESPDFDPSAQEAHEIFRAWMPQTESFVLPRATHALQMRNPADMARGLAQFFQRHPMGLRSG